MRINADPHVHSYLIEGVDLNRECLTAYRRLAKPFPRPTLIHHHLPTRPCNGEIHTTFTVEGMTRGRYPRATRSPSVP